MKKFRSILLTVLIIASTITAYGAGYVATVANYKVNVNDQPLSTTVLNMDGSTYLSVRAISEAVGVPIEWDSAKKSVEINTVDIERLKEACVMIFAENSTQGSQGSAVAIDYGQYLTAYHIVDNGQTNIRTSGGSKMTVGQTNEKLDAATLNASDNVKPVKIGDSDEVKAGDRVLIISSPKREEDTVSWTTVKRLTNEIVVTSTLGVGSSGGGVFNQQAELIGILVAGSDSTKEGYVVPINEIRKAF